MADINIHVTVTEEDDNGGSPQKYPWEVDTTFRARQGLWFFPLIVIFFVPIIMAAALMPDLGLRKIVVFYVAYLGVSLYSYIRGIKGLKDTDGTAREKYAPPDTECAHFYIDYYAKEQTLRVFLQIALNFVLLAVLVAVTSVFSSSKEGGSMIMIAFIPFAVVEILALFTLISAFRWVVSYEKMKNKRIRRLERKIDKLNRECEKNPYSYRSGKVADTSLKGLFVGYLLLVLGTSFRPLFKRSKKKRR